VGPSVVHGNLAVVQLGMGGTSTSVDDVSVTGQTVLMAVGGSNTIAIDNLVAGSTFGGSVGIFMGGTNNLLEIDSHNTSGATTTFDGPVLADLGDGNDALILAQAGNVDFKMASTFIGGAGTNHAFVNNQNIEGVPPTLINFG
jgi:hypothetical protein